METLTYSGQLVITKCYCGMSHAVPQELYNYQLNKHHNGLSTDGIYCPLGHRWYFGSQREVDRLKREIEREQIRTRCAQSDLKDERNRHKATKDTLNAEKAAKSRLKNRVAKGMCPCCRRHFCNVAAHMKKQHPDFVTPD